MQNDFRKLKSEYEFLAKNGTKKQQVEARLHLKLLEKKEKEIVSNSQQKVGMPWKR